MDDARLSGMAASKPLTSDVEAGVRMLLADAAQVTAGTDLLINQRDRRFD